MNSFQYSYSRQQEITQNTQSIQSIHHQRSHFHDQFYPHALSATQWPEGVTAPRPTFPREGRSYSWSSNFSSPFIRSQRNELETVSSSNGPDHRRGHSLSSLGPTYDPHSPLIASHNLHPSFPGPAAPSAQTGYNDPGRSTSSLAESHYPVARLCSTGPSMNLPQFRNPFDHLPFSIPYAPSGDRLLSTSQPPPAESGYRDSESKFAAFASSSSDLASSTTHGGAAPFSPPTPDSISDTHVEFISEEEAVPVFSHAGQTRASNAFLSSPTRFDRRAEQSAVRTEEESREEADRLSIFGLARAQAHSQHHASDIVSPQREVGAHRDLAIENLHSSPSSMLSQQGVDDFSSSPPLLSPGLFASPPRKPVFNPAVFALLSQSSQGSETLEGEDKSNSTQVASFAEQEEDQRKESDERLAWIAPTQAPVFTLSRQTSTKSNGSTQASYANEEDRTALSSAALDTIDSSSTLSSPPPSDDTSADPPARAPWSVVRNALTVSVPTPPSQTLDEMARSLVLKTDWRSQSFLFGPYVPNQEVVNGSGKTETLAERLEGPLLVYADDVDAWIAYRRNYLAFDTSITLPRSRSKELFVGGQRVHEFVTVIKAYNIKPDVVPGAPKRRRPAQVPKCVSLLQFDLTRKLSRAVELDAKPFQNSTDDPHGHELVSSYSRVQFRHATANHSVGSINSNGIGKALRLIVLLAARLDHANGEVIEIGRWESSEIVVRGRCPKNFGTDSAPTLSNSTNAKKSQKHRKARATRRRARLIDEEEEGDEDFDRASSEEEQQVDVPPRGTRSRPTVGRKLVADIRLENGTTVEQSGVESQPQAGPSRRSGSYREKRKQ